MPNGGQSVTSSPDPGGPAGRVTPLDILGAQFRFLFFRPFRFSPESHFGPWLIYVLAVTWIAGVGRYWDHPSAYPWQYLGLGSVAYIFCLSALLYLVVLPLRPPRWDYRAVLIFVGLTSLPAVLYAIPVERFTDLDTAKTINAWFLGVVAIWRVALLMTYLRRYARLHWFVVVTVTVLLLSGIVVALSLLNLEHVVFDLMAGIRDENASPNDAAYTVVVTLALFSLFAFPVALVSYLGAIVLRHRSASASS